MKTRTEAAAFIKQQLAEETPYIKSKHKLPWWCWHYGKVELEELLDFIYGFSPECDLLKTRKEKYQMFYKVSRDYRTRDDIILEPEEEEN